MRHLWKKYLTYAFLACGLFAFAACSDDDDAPEPENEGETITDVTLIFTNLSDPTDVVRASAKDPDGAGIREIEVLDAITLRPESLYALNMEILDASNPNDIEDIAEEIEEEDDEHQFFFAFTNNAFSIPTGGGNIDGNSEIVYNDFDANGNPLGLSTLWTTAGTLNAGFFRVRLQHQPDIKSSTTTANDGDIDVDLTFTLNIR
ncbi:MAG: hypothetical protein ACFCUI_10355 [Bernardetiaceae bacterium]